MYLSEAWEKDVVGQKQVKWELAEESDHLYLQVAIYLGFTLGLRQCYAYATH